MPADSQIFKATYSGIPVYEMMCKGVAVMRRREDSWLNATQILKVAGFDKPQRTRILEREVQKGIHEKVQGGYGKYQGTWIPLERGIALCQQYNCENLLRPIVEFQPDEKSPPLAPKHLVAAPTIASKPTTRRSEVPIAPSAVSTRSSRRNVRDVGDMSDNDSLSLRGSDDGSMTPSPSEASSSSRTPSPIRSSLGPRSISNLEEDDRSPSPPTHRKRKYRQDGLDKDVPSMGINGYPMRDPSSYGDQILEFFISDTNQTPHILINPPADFDSNMAIDDDGHTALHWASAMGRIRVVKLLLTAGADIFRVNKAGQTALMRSVMFANNYDVRKFPELYELLHRSTLNIDNNNRTVFHHIVDVAMSKQKTHAARYYMETVLNRLAAYPQELADVINFQDEDGETALTLAARCRSKRLIKLLIDHGANPKIRNRDGKSAEDYILEDERFRSSPIIPTRDVNARTMQPVSLGPSPLAASPFPFPPANGSDRPSLHYSSAAQKAATRCVSEVATLLDSLAASYDQELREKERDMTQASGLLQNIQTEILESQRSVNSLKAQAQPLQEAKERLVALEGELRAKMGRRYRYGWEKWIKDETEREKMLRDASGGELPVQMQTDGPDSPLRAPNGEDISDLRALYKNVPSDPEALKQECERLRQEIQEHGKRRAELFDALVAAQADAGTGGRMAEYRRLIGIGCGGVAPGDVDNVVTMLLETLESEEPSASTPWNTTSVAKQP